MRLGIIGGGRAAWAFGRSLQQAGWPVEGVTLRPDSTSTISELLGVPRLDSGELAGRCDLLFVAVSDGALASVAEQLAGASITLFHASGFHPGAVLGGGGFSLHPLRSLPPVGADVTLEGTLLTFEGPDELLPVGQDIVTAVRGRMARIPAESKPLYHSAAVFAANYVASICQAAEELFLRAGIETDVREAVDQLARSAIENWRASGVDGFTGPLSRGDGAVVEAHLRALQNDPEAQKLYAAIGVAMLDQIVRRRPDHPDFQEIARRLKALRLP